MKDVNSFIDSCAIAMFGLLLGAALYAMFQAVAQLWR